MFNHDISIYQYKEFLSKIIDSKNIEDHGPYKLVFRCPVCGDSKKNKYKKRGFLLISSDGKSTIGCLNCDYRASFYYFLKINYPELCSEWLMNVILNDGTYVRQLEEEVKEICHINYDEFIPLKNKDDSINRKKTIRLINHRRLPKHIAKNFLYADNGNFENRMIIPYYYKDGTFKYFEARDLTGNSPQKYKFPRAMPQELYNIGFIDKTKYFFVFEGVLDSIFVNNSIAIGGVTKFNRLLDEIDEKYYPNIVVVFDGDIDGIKKSYKLLKKGFKVFVWNSEMMSHSVDGKVDLNKLIMDGFFDDVLDDNGQIPEKEMLKYVYESTMSKILDFELYYEFTLNFDIENKEAKKDNYNVRSIQKTRTKPNKNSRNTRKSWSG